MEQKEINELIEKAKAEAPNISKVLVLMDLTYNEGVDDCIHEINKFIITQQSEYVTERLSNLINSLTSLKKDNNV